MEFFTFAIYVGLRAFGFLLLGRVNSIYTLPAEPKLKVHIGLLTAEMICLFINFHFIIYHMHKFSVSNRIAAYHVQIYLVALIEILQCLRLHHIFILDHRQLGNSYESCSKKFHCDMAADVVKMIVLFLYILCAGSIKSLPSLLFSLSNLFIAIFSLTSRLQAIRVWHGILDVINKELQDATPENLQVDSICLICRDSMTIGNAKKLPCGHVYHLECLEKWISQQSVCPICHYDLTNFLKGKPEEETPGQTALRVLTEVRHDVFDKKIEGRIPGQDNALEYFQNLEMHIRDNLSSDDDEDLTITSMKFSDFDKDHIGEPEEEKNDNDNLTLTNIIENLDDSNQPQNEIDFAAIEEEDVTEFDFNSFLDIVSDQNNENNDEIEEEIVEPPKPKQKPAKKHKDSHHVQENEFSGEDEEIYQKFNSKIDEMENMVYQMENSLQSMREELKLLFQKRNQKK
ncbi:hypothetical protein TVAG_474070 [Trichomonas vaginalis G3]|uniref:RING-type domain-containing protein n=1 Tax=Trichomonas vaginalis (strain ATCC PRA-98 / G3) TaxID=412133 RepID=A2EQ53_TRIV3|nr:protein polyubiquitination [Trichomonas vaginalis G3]EAY05228.1 hypothetical protein TVAG_474070 [Trichomonas vaginalis G3]KAI5542605.1 protein polyubiquitination [Trichomonas vaginalis G3]|eukprot:XP_001317451.1 hypothetical protein [Trichomonas vaginalis G3]